MTGVEYFRITAARAMFQRDEVLKLRREGLSWRQIAKTIGLSLSTIRRACQNPRLCSEV